METGKKAGKVWMEVGKVWMEEVDGERWISGCFGISFLISHTISPPYNKRFQLIVDTQGHGRPQGTLRLNFTTLFS